VAPDIGKVVERITQDFRYRIQIFIPRLSDAARFLLIHLIINAMEIELVFDILYLYIRRRVHLSLRKKLEKTLLWTF